ncbi:MAG: hypothetical protein ABIU11_08485 [Chitinophagaceae bacterium]
MQRNTKIFVVLFILSLPTCLSAQKIYHRPQNKQQVVGKMQYDQNKWMYKSSTQYVKYPVTNLPSANVSVVQKPLVWLIINNRNSFHLENTYQLPQDFYTQSLGFICRQEYRFQKYTAVPLRIRLGSLAYVNYLEQKPNAVNSK